MQPLFDQGSLAGSPVQRRGRGVQLAIQFMGLKVHIVRNAQTKQGRNRQAKQREAQR
jgi:hypothetical protein